MGKDSHIEWTDHTFNPWEGCTKVSPGCAHCYAEARNKRFGGGTAPNWGKGAPRRRTSLQNWNHVRRWNREEASKMVSHAEFVAAARPRVFCASLADWLDDEVPLEWFMDLLMLINECQNLDFQLLTKRPENWHDRVANALVELKRCPIPESLDFGQAETARWLEAWIGGKAPANVWVGTSVEDQTRADERIPLLRQIPARVRFLSMEPLLGHVSLYAALKVCGSWQGAVNDWTKADYSTVKFARQSLMPIGWKNCVDWVIVGGESGAGSRPMHPDWPRALRDQCAAAGVPFFFKQWGEWAPGGPVANPSVLTFMGPMMKCGKIAAGRQLDGREWNELPCAR